ncbi:hypothetical protein KBD45_05830 [Candidatus Dojkabacteria bacterium]|nr:hypothetical protein [Candidatus Dojkabacteria bacterium]
MKANKITRKLPYLIIFSVILFVLTGCSNISNPESETGDAGLAQDAGIVNNPVFKALAANIDE